MSLIYISILYPLIFAIINCEGYPATYSKELTGEKLALRFFDRYEKLKSNNLGIDMEEKKLPKNIKEVWINPIEITSEDSRVSLHEDESKIGNIIPDTPETDFLYDYNTITDKRGTFKPKYNYYKCYFNPVTCYRK